MAEELTRNQTLVLESLVAAGTPLSAYAILDVLRPRGLKAPLQIYRALNRLVERGLVHRLESLNAFIACRHGEGDRMAVFLICQRCGMVDEQDAPALQVDIAGIARSHNFARESVVLEIKGLCRRCLGAAAETDPAQRFRPQHH